MTIFSASLWKKVIYFYLGIAIKAKADLLRGLDVPQYAFVDGSAILTCAYDLSSTALYSLKWYHNNTEFYRYVPTERDKPINIGPTHKFYLREVSRTDSRNILNLSKLTMNASGVYRCEVIAEHPSFRTETLKDTMIVLRERLKPPDIFDVKYQYEPQDMIQITCQPKRSSISEHQPSIKWYLNGQLVGPEKLQEYNRKFNPRSILRISALEILNQGGEASAECRLVLGSHQQSTTKHLRVRASYSYNFYSKACDSATPELMCILCMLLYLFVHL